MKFHPLSEIFELMDDAALDILAADIKANGLRVPIVLHPDGSILDGRNRYRACLKAERTPRFETWDGVGLATDFVWSLNFTRRQLDDGAKTIAAGKYAVAREAEAKERQIAALKQNAGRAQVAPLLILDPAVDSGSSLQVCNDGEYGRSVEKAAEKFGLSVGTVSKSVKVIKDGDDSLIKAVERNEVSVSAAADVATLPKPQQAEIVARGEKEILEAAKQIRVARGEATRQRNDELRKEALAIPPPAGKYRCIVIDPPWDVQKFERDVRPNQSEALDYPTMSHEQIAAMDLGRNASEDGCHLFCWTTQKHLPPTLEIVKAWGFEYCLVMVWHKPGGPQPWGLPQYNCEFVVYARRGSPQFLDTKQFFACFEAPRREHSRKPDEFYDLIRRVTPEPRIDWFSREKREGFDQCGVEPGKFAA